MSEPFIFIATNRLKQRKLEAERGRVAGLSDFIEECCASRRYSSLFGPLRGEAS
jgi:hypothetical protein